MYYNYFKATSCSGQGVAGCGAKFAFNFLVCWKCDTYYKRLKFRQTFLLKDIFGLCCRKNISVESFFAKIPVTRENR